MRAPPFPDNEVARVDALLQLDQTHTPAERRFDRITESVRDALDVPIVLISLVTADRQWFKSAQGLAAAETSRDISFCGHAILGDAVFVVEDALAHPDFRDNPLVTGAPGIRFYAGAPLRLDGGLAIGTLCVIDTSPRQLSDGQRQQLREMGDLLVRELQQRGLSELELDLLLDADPDYRHQLIDPASKCWNVTAAGVLLAAALEHDGSDGNEQCRPLVGLLRLQPACGPAADPATQWHDGLGLAWANGLRAALPAGVILAVVGDGEFLLLDPDGSSGPALAALGGAHGQLAATFLGQLGRAPARADAVLVRAEGLDGRAQRALLMLLRERLQALPGICLQAQVVNAATLQGY